MKPYVLRKPKYKRKWGHKPTKHVKAVSAGERRKKLYGKQERPGVHAGGQADIKLEKRGKVSEDIGERAYTAKISKIKGEDVKGGFAEADALLKRQGLTHEDILRIREEKKGMVRVEERPLTQPAEPIKEEAPKEEGFGDWRERVEEGKGAWYDPGITGEDIPDIINMALAGSPGLIVGAGGMISATTNTGRAILQRAGLLKITPVGTGTLYGDVVHAIGAGSTVTYGARGAMTKGGMSLGAKLGVGIFGMWFLKELVEGFGFADFATAKVADSWDFVIREAVKAGEFEIAELAQAEIDQLTKPENIGPIENFFDSLPVTGPMIDMGRAVKSLWKKNQVRKELTAKAKADAEGGVDSKAEAKMKGYIIDAIKTKIYNKEKLTPEEERIWAEARGIDPDYPGMTQEKIDYYESVKK